MLTIVTGKDQPILHTVCKTVEKFDDDLIDLLTDMEDTMLGDQEGGVSGIGLAANQVGIDARIMLVTFNVGQKKNMKVVPMINPEIIEVSEQKISMEEGCLSLPGQLGQVIRPAKIKARWQNAKGNWCEKKLNGWDARIFLHELDHLDGKLFIDYL